MAVIGNNPNYSAVTDAAGKFRIENIEPGVYRVQNRKAGYVPSRTVQGFSPHWLKLAAAESLKDLRYALLPQAVVTGRVLDDEGEPVQGVTVSCMRPLSRRGFPRMYSGGQAQTNDRGEYRVVGLESGKYYVQANIQRMMLTGAAPVSTTTAGEHNTALLSTYYPNALDSAHATRVEARPGLEISSQDITLRREKVFNVSGTALDVDGSPAKQSIVTLVQDDEVFANEVITGSGVDEKGKFTLGDVRPGRYTLALSREDGQSHRSTQSSITVGDADLTRVLLQLPPTLEAKGMIALEGADKKDFDFKIWVNASPADWSPFGGAGCQAKPDGSFTLSQLTPGRYTVNANIANGYVQSIQVGSEDVFGKEVDAATLAVAGIRIVLRLDAAKVAGSVEIPEDRKAHVNAPTVVFVPADARLRSGGRFMTIELDQTNRFDLQGVRPGDYLAFAFEDFEYGAFEEPEVFAAVESQATKVTLGRNESKELTLKILPWPAQFADRLQ